MCLIVTIVMLGLSIQSFIQHQWFAASVQLIIAIGFILLLIRNIMAARNQQQGCSTTRYGISDYFANLFNKEHK